MRRRLATFLLLFGFWLLLSFTLEPSFVVVGLVLTIVMIFVLG